LQNSFFDTKLEYLKGVGAQKVDIAIYQETKRLSSELLVIY
jgi:hypothetical protein